MASFQLGLLLTIAHFAYKQVRITEIQWPFSPFYLVITCAKILGQDFGIPQSLSSFNISKLKEQFSLSLFVT